MCSRAVLEKDINAHLDNNCSEPGSSKQKTVIVPTNTQKHSKSAIAPIFEKPKHTSASLASQSQRAPSSPTSSAQSQKRSLPDISNFTDASRTLKRAKAATTTTKFASAAPLAERLRPQSLDQFIGQPHLTSLDSALMGLLHRRSTGSIILWGPPG